MSKSIPVGTRKMVNLLGQGHCVYTGKLSYDVYSCDSAKSIKHAWYTKRRIGTVEEVSKVMMKFTNLIEVRVRKFAGFSVQATTHALHHSDQGVLIPAELSNKAAGCCCWWHTRFACSQDPKKAI